MKFSADGRVLGERGARTFLVFRPYVLVGTPLVPVVSKSRWSSPRQHQFWSSGHPNPDIVYLIEPVGEDETRGTVVRFCC